MTKNNQPWDHYSEKATLAIIIALILFALSVGFNIYTSSTQCEYITPAQIEETAIIFGLG